MPPFDLNKKNVPCAVKERVRPGDLGQHVHQEHVNRKRWVVLGPDSVVVCEACFCQTNDIAQHISRKAGCSLYLACQHVLHCYDNCMIDNAPRVHVISAMCQDDRCPVTARDILAQSSEWNPQQPFQHCDSHGIRQYTAGPALTAASFETLYNQCLAAHPELNVPEHPDAMSDAVDRSASAYQFPIWHEKFLEKHYQARVNADVAAGKLTRNPEAPAGH